MKIRSIGGWLLATALPFAMMSCKDDEPKPAGIGFEASVEEITESDGTIKSFHPQLWEDYSGETGATGRVHEIKLTLDKPVSATSVVEFTLGGTATRSSASTEGDYEIEGTSVTIEKGESEAVIPITIFEDFEFEISEADSLFETIELTLSSVVSGPLNLGEQTTYKLRINEDDAVWFLQWGVNDTDNPGDVDMDILFHFDGQLVWGVYTDRQYEAINVPGGFPSGTYGASYTYYSGSSDDVDFLVALFTTAGTLNNAKYTFPVDDPLIYEGHYTLNNINKWDEPDAQMPIVVQSATKSGINYTVTDITEPTSGSRTRTLKTRLRTGDMRIVPLSRLPAGRK